MKFLAFRMPAFRMLSAMYIIFAHGCAPLDELPGQWDYSGDGGAVIVDARIEVEDPLNGKGKAYIMKAALKKIDQTKESIPGRKVSGMILFPDLAAGKYRLENIGYTSAKKGYRENYEYDVPDYYTELDFDIAPGDVKYIGRVRINDRRRLERGKVYLRLDSSPKYEVAALYELIHRYGDGNLRRLLEHRLGAIMGK